MAFLRTSSSGNRPIDQKTLPDPAVRVLENPELTECVRVIWVAKVH